MTAARRFLLVPGAGGSAWYWHRVVAELERRGYAATAVELPGDDDTAGLEEYVAAVLAAGGDDPSDLVMVGHSLGGFSATVACTRLPASALIFVNAMIPLPGETAGDWWDNTGQAAAKAAKDRDEGRAVDGPFDPMTYFFHDVPPEVVAAGAAHDKTQSGACFATPAGFTAWPDIPIHVIIGRDDRFFPAEFQRRVAAQRLGVTPVELPGGHLVALSHPVALTDALVAAS